jgi:hypothetical protein
MIAAKVPIIAARHGFSVLQKLEQFFSESPSWSGFPVISLSKQGYEREMAPASAAPGRLTLSADRAASGVQR